MSKLHQICYNPVAIKARFCMFFICKLVTLLQILKYAFKTFTFCIVAFGYSIVICGKWFLRFIICFHIHAGLANWFYVLQVYNSCLCLVVNLSFDIFLYGFNVLVDQKS